MKFRGYRLRAMGYRRGTAELFPKPEALF